MKKRKNLGGGEYLRKLRYPMILILVVGASFLMLHNSNKEIILKNEVQENTLAIYLEDEQINYIPEKDSGYTLDLTKSSCNNGVTIGFDYNTWSVKTNYSNYTNPDNTRVKCSLYFKKRTFAESLVDCGALSKDAGTCIKENYYLTEEVVDDETADNNLRFIGANPENYVWFNDELWRIIGVMNNIDDGNGNKETRLKIIRDEPIGEYSWDSSDTNTNGGNGVNEWSKSDIQLLLNDYYFNQKKDQICYQGENNQTIPCDFSSIGLNTEAKSMLDQALWNLGSNPLEPNYREISPFLFYTFERSNNSSKICSPTPSCNDTIERTATWIGKIGLMYPSDYGYATSGGTTTDRTTCLNTYFYSWPSSSDCYNNNWLVRKDKNQWTMTANARSDSAYQAFSATYVGGMSYNNVDNTFLILPALYLKSSIKIISGSGTKEQPFIIVE